MRKTITTTAALAALTVLIANLSLSKQEQAYPNVEDVPVVFENEHVVAQRLELEAGKWAGEHAHPGRQLGVVLEGFEGVFKESGKETPRNYKDGEVFWVDATAAHDHMAKDAGTIILITLKETGAEDTAAE